MDEYRLMIVRNEKGKYFVSPDEKEEPKVFSDFPSLINQIFIYSTEKPQIFEKVPSFVDLPEDEEEIIRGLRKWIINERKLDSLARK